MPVPKVFLRTPYNYDTDAASDETALDCSVDGAGKTVQSQRDDADINVILKRFGITGDLPISQRIPLVLDDADSDSIGILDYRECLEIQRKAAAAFMTVPVELRNKLDNDPAKYIDWLADEANNAEAERLGLRVPKPSSSESSSPAPGGSPAA